MLFYLLPQCIIPVIKIVSACPCQSATLIPLPQPSLTRPPLTPTPSTDITKQEHIECSSLGRATNVNDHQPASNAAHLSNNGNTYTSQHLSARQDSSFWDPISQYPTEPAASSCTVSLLTCMNHSQCRANNMETCTRPAEMQQPTQASNAYVSELSCGA
jgi:hypothetical protein